ncbi:uncharacterized protein LOC123871144 [Maniola jurtina]|uniref:uncharacterized protein LOC123871144 n=1 Tax=Maniola jurtina TaxID=191418 RepID=UPI001E685FB5|nr:uncharacterized protein LOC123871144 [Maniola jurtina]XP_045770718.1 uncharacterized protein LOC123871144 [Maniola jurtina]XP_045770719.1 uncharacterized protein LOC123871144 [Maniola jurtina]XP_045770720.1 uncharacterized protein LOC123871144 [Maniola jurtina]
MVRERASAGSLPDMYRLIFPLLLCASAAAAAPQAPGAAPAYIQPLVSDEPPANATSLEDSFGSAPPSPESTASESNEFIRHARQDSFTTELDDPDTTETEEVATERELITSPRTSPGRTFSRPARPTPPSPRFISKLSYFDKPSAPSGVVTNLVEKAEKVYPGYLRKFVSSCRCEKIWNCPKLQITVPRCPNEYFMCCL